MLRTAVSPGAKFVCRSLTRFTRNLSEQGAHHQPCPTNFGSLDRHFMTSRRATDLPIRSLTSAVTLTGRGLSSTNMKVSRL